jgi:hypothetical protein
VGGFGELLGGGGQAFFRSLQILFQKLDASVQGGDFTLSLDDREKNAESSFTHSIDD